MNRVSEGLLRVDREGREGFGGILVPQENRVKIRILLLISGSHVYVHGNATPAMICYSCVCDDLPIQSQAIIPKNPSVDDARTLNT